jgi:PmbA protein
MIDDVLSRARKAAQEAEVVFYESRDIPVSFEANRLKSITTRETRGMALRVIKDGRIGLAYSSKLDSPQDLQNLVDQAVTLAQFGAWAKFSFPATTPSNGVQVFDQEVERLTVEQMVELGGKVLDRLRNHDKALLCGVDVSTHIARIELCNSRGGGTAYRKSVMSLSASINLVRGEDILDIWDYEVSCKPTTDGTVLTNRIIERLEQARTNAKAKTKKMPVLFTPMGVASTLLSPLRFAFDGKTVLQGASPLSDKLEQEVFHPSFSLYDDGTIDYATASAPADDEGVPIRRHALAENGVVRMFIYDLQTAGLAGKESTGNARRSPESQPSPGFHNLVIPPGKGSLQDLISGMDEGVMVDYMLGASQGNLYSGDFSGNVHLGYRIEGGKVVGRVKDTMVAGNVYEALKRIAAIGGEPQWVGGRTYTPPILVEELSVSTKGEL